MGNVQLDSVVELAQFCAELTRQGIVYKSTPHNGGYLVTLTGY
jgi:hypothetical protein